MNYIVWLQEIIFDSHPLTYIQKDSLLDKSEYQFYLYFPQIA